jgi:hypothetical protein
MNLRKFQMPGSRRRAINLRLQPGLQLRLPAVVFGLTGAFGLLFAAHTNRAWGKFVQIGVDEQWLQELVAYQQRDYLMVSLAIGAAYIFTVLIACLAHGHRLLGPLVPIRRQIGGLINGDYATRTHLRDGDPFSEVAEDLNELAGVLQELEKRETTV